MLNLLSVIGAGLLAAATSDPVAADASPTEPSRVEYDALKTRLGSDGAAQVGLALWCETHAMGQEKQAHLERAVAIDPGDTRARGLMGLVDFQGLWLPPRDVTRAAIKNEERQGAALAEYNGRREQADRQEKTRRAEYSRHPNGKGHPNRLANTLRTIAMDRFTLGLSCEKVGLNDEARVEYTQDVHADPGFDDAWKRLGYVHHDGRWMTPDAAAAAKAEAKAQLAANAHWEPLLTKWKNALKDKKRQVETEEELGKVNDPRAVTAVERVFCDAREDHQAWAVRILGRIDAPRSSRILASLAVFSRFDTVRRSSIAILAKRPIRDYAQMLVDVIQAPWVYAIDPMPSPGSLAVLTFENPRYHVVSHYAAPYLFAASGAAPGDVRNGVSAGYDVNGLPVIAANWELTTFVGARRSPPPVPLAILEQRTAAMIAQFNFKVLAAQQRLEADVIAIEQSNARLAGYNAWATEVLRDAAGAPDLKDDEVAWNQWYYDQVGYSYTPPKQVRMHMTGFIPSYPFTLPHLTSCFVAGTSVRTIHGPRPIESIRAGERVLCQSVTSGALAYQPVLVTHHNPPASTVRVVFENGELLIPSIYHRFWMAGKGWVMARDLKPGDVLRTLGGLVTVTAATPGAVVPVFNLTVASDHTYFVGEHNCLVHDNVIPDSVPAPFDALPAPLTVSR